MVARFDCSDMTVDPLGLVCGQSGAVEGLGLSSAHEASPAPPPAPVVKAPSPGGMG